MHLLTPFVTTIAPLPVSLGHRTERLKIYKYAKHRFSDIGSLKFVGKHFALIVCRQAERRESVFMVSMICIF